MEKAGRVLGLYAGEFCFQPFGNLELEAGQGRQAGRERKWPRNGGRMAVS